MRKEYQENINQVKLRIKNGEVADVMNALSWISLLQLADAAGSGRFYKNHFFMLIDYDNAVKEMLYAQDLFPETVYEPDFITKNGYIYVVCYDTPNYIGIPKFAVKAPYFKFSELSPNGKKRVFESLIDICESYDSDLFGDGIDII